MFVMSTWALLSMTVPRFRTENGFTFPADPVPWAGVVLLSLAAVMLVEAIGASSKPIGRRIHWHQNKLLRVECQRAFEVRADEIASLPTERRDSRSECRQSKVLASLVLWNHLEANRATDRECHW